MLAAKLRGKRAGAADANRPRNVSSRIETTRNGSELCRQTVPWGPFAPARYGFTGFSFRRGTPWGFKSLLEHK